MLRNYIIIGLRNLLHHKVFSLINISGLALGIACFTTILLYVEHEFSFDRFHHNPGDVYRVVKDFINTDGTRIPDATTPPALTPVLRNDLPEVASVTRLFPNWGRKNLFQYGEKSFYELGVIRVDNHFFDVFDFPFILGSKENAFNGPHSILVTQSAATKYFGQESPMGKVIRININNGTDYQVTGVLKDVPQHSHFKFDFVIPFESGRDPDIDWNRYSFYTYVRLKPGTDPAAFESNVQNLFAKYQPNSTNEYYIQPLTEIHLRSHLKWELLANGDLQQVRVLALIAFLTVVIACINYVNLITAQSAKRAKEVGIRKVTGAVYRSLFHQFIVEAGVTFLLAFLVSIIVTSVFFSLSRQVLGYDLSFLLAESKLVWLIPLAILVFGILAGMYPSVYFSRLKPLKTLRSGVPAAEKALLRRALVIAQFSISSFLIVASLVISQQLSYMQEKKLGFSGENVLMLPNVRGGNNPEAMVEELRKLPDVTSIGRADGVFGVNNSTNTVRAKHLDDRVGLSFMRVDYDFLPTLHIELIEGRNFSEQFGSDTTGIILNEKAASQLGLREPYTGQLLVWDDADNKTHEVTIVGVVRDFHFTSFHESIKPFGFILEVNNGSTFFLKTTGGNPGRTIASIEGVWKSHFPERPFEYSFQDEQMANLQLSDERFYRLFTCFTVLSIIIGCLGLFGLVTYMADSRAKEIGIRKVLGSTVAGVVGLLSKEYTKLVLIAFIIASPIAYFACDYWLRGFAYRVSIDWQVFAAAACVTTVLALGTISFKAIKAALANPVESLRNE